MKTPLQQLIEKWEEDTGYVRPGKIHTHAPIFQAFIDDAKAMLEKEKEFMKGVWLDGRNSHINGQDPMEQIKNL